MADLRSHLWGVRSLPALSAAAMARASCTASSLDSPADRRKRPQRVRRPGGASAEHAALDLAAVVLEGVIQVHGGGLGGCFGIPVPDGTIDRLVFADGGAGVAAQPPQADDAGPALPHAGLADGGDEG